MYALHSHYCLYSHSHFPPKRLKMKKVGSPFLMAKPSKAGKLTKNPNASKSRKAIFSFKAAWPTSSTLAKWKNTTSRTSSSKPKLKLPPVPTLVFSSTPKIVAKVASKKVTKHRSTIPLSKTHAKLQVWLMSKTGSNPPSRMMNGTNTTSWSRENRS